MDSSEDEGSGATGTLPPPLPLPRNAVPNESESEPAKKVVRVPMARKGFGSKGQKISILTNHFKVNVGSVDGHFFHYSVRNCLLRSASLFFLIGK
ncbi:protein argonaute 4-like [Durio zibethinus]|uniref:Protein argonaute 4-like n=1 Tax=Durio zibethinus TaxID=66656 RepID=A0A6P5XSH2_DURZI|nr:protein argonaute 4-like [Durio zibethinus]